MILTHAGHSAPVLADLFSAFIHLVLWPQETGPCKRSRGLPGGLSQWDGVLTLPVPPCWAAVGQRLSFCQAPAPSLGGLSGFQKQLLSLGLQIDLLFVVYY